MNNVAVMGYPEICEYFFDFGVEVQCPDVECPILTLSIASNDFKTFKSVFDGLKEQGIQFNRFL